MELDYTKQVIPIAKMDFEKNINSKFDIPLKLQKILMNGNAQFIIDMSKLLKMSYTLSELSIVLCHYFFIKKCYYNYDRFVS